MPFIPLSPEGLRWHTPPCDHPEHNPPSHMIITGVMKWQCPNCGNIIIVHHNFASNDCRS